MMRFSCYLAATVIVTAAPSAQAQLGQPERDGELPPPAYYVEPPQPREPQRRESEVTEPPLPRRAPQLVWEPPPPPQPRHIAPRSAFWLGARVGWFVPFGNLFARAVEVQDRLFVYRRVPWGDYSDPGPLFEVNAGARIARHYNLFALWERAELGAGRATTDAFGGGGTQQRGDTDYWALGVRASSNANDVGFLSELSIGYRRGRARFADGSELHLSSGLLETRVGLGADIRLNEFFSLSPMLTFGVGTFAEVDLVDADGRVVDRISRLDDYDGHGWFTLQMGGHFDLAGRN